MAAAVRQKHQIALGDRNRLSGAVRLQEERAALDHVELCLVRTEDQAPRGGELRPAVDLTAEAEQPQDVREDVERTLLLGQPHLGHEATPARRSLASLPGPENRGAARGPPIRQVA